MPSRLHDIPRIGGDTPAERRLIHSLGIDQVAATQADRLGLFREFTAVGPLRTARNDGKSDRKQQPARNTVDFHSIYRFRLELHLFYPADDHTFVWPQRELRGSRERPDLAVLRVPQLEFRAPGKLSFTLWARSVSS